MTEETGVVAVVVVTIPSVGGEDVDSRFESISDVAAVPSATAEEMTTVEVEVVKLVEVVLSIGMSGTMSPSTSTTVFVGDSLDDSVGGGGDVVLVTGAIVSVVLPMVEPEEVARVPGPVSMSVERMSTSVSLSMSPFNSTVVVVIIVVVVGGNLCDTSSKTEIVEAMGSSSSSTSSTTSGTSSSPTSPACCCCCCCWSYLWDLGRWDEIFESLRRHHVCWRTFATIGNQWIRFVRKTSFFGIVRSAARRVCRSH
mmetsp:Transcript_12013/g.22562  ORF Transcript_12013/g.22562 Transcript_12013/m.22562 type:complete len:254 (-) Transcript_12013:2083-2844(-)